MYTCSKFISARGPDRCEQSRVLWPHSFPAEPSKPATFQGIVTQSPSSLELELPQLWWLVLELGLGLVLEASSSAIPETFPEATTCVLCNSGLCPLRSHGALWPNGGLSHPLCYVKQQCSLPPPTVLSPVFYLPFKLLFLPYTGSL